VNVVRVSATYSLRFTSAVSAAFNVRASASVRAERLRWRPDGSRNTTM
jgi:hypothetical protein